MTYDYKCNNCGHKWYSKCEDEVCPVCGEENIEYELISGEI